MLALTRRKNESIQIGEHVVVTVLEVSGGRVSLGVDAPRAVGIQRCAAPPQTRSGGNTEPGPEPVPAPVGKD